MLMNNSNMYINRELSWLKFNTRVLLEAKNDRLPLLDKLKYLAIYGTNLDEFYMVRVAGLIELFKTGAMVSSADKLTPSTQLSEIRKYLHSEKTLVEDNFSDLIIELKKKRLYLKDYKQLNKKEKEEVEKYFYTNLFPLLIPIAVDTTHPFPILNNLSFGMVVKLKRASHSDLYKYALVRIPRVLPRFVELNQNTFIPIESIIKNYIQDLFPSHILVSALTYRVTRNADMDIKEEEADDFMEIMEEGLRLRQKGNIVRLEVQGVEDNDLLNFLIQHIHVDLDDIYHYKIPLNLSSLWQIVGNKNFAHLTAPSYKPAPLLDLDSRETIFDIIDNSDIFLYHPYDSFDPVVKFIQEASKDKDVLSIKMTLYRVGSNSPIVKALIDACKDGKQVTVMVELRARFDEENNLQWARALESAGAHVVYGIKGLKVHAKVALVIKEVNSKLKYYMHFATGNYNPSTARIYTDISLLTCQEDIGKDAIRFFHNITGISTKIDLKSFYTSPFHTKPVLLNLIANESSKKEEGRIILKTNALVDSDIIDALYEASNQGVKIDLIVRGICCLKPNVKGMSENIRVISIIGKYLEHARIYYFKHSTPNIYISSADLMTRNLKKRIEIMLPIYSNKIANYLLQILQLQLNDNQQAYELNSNSNYEKIITDKEPINSQEESEKYYTKIHKMTKSERISKVDKLINRLFKDS
jgi:polyphosphate kinase